MYWIVAMVTIPVYTIDHNQAASSESECEANAKACLEQ